MTSAVYARVSSEEQAREGYSIQSQIRAGHLYAELHGLGPLEEYVEPGLTGRDTNRPQFQRLMADIRAGRVTHVIVWRMNRLHRNLRNFLETLALLEEKDVTLHSVTEHVDTKSATGRLLVNVLASFHAFESDKLSEDVRMGTRQKVREGGWANHAPTGYRMEHGVLLLDEDKADLVRAAFTEAAQGASVRAIARTLGCTPSAVPYMLRNPVYVGLVFERLADLPRERSYATLTGCEGVYEGLHVPLVSPAAWDAVQAARFRRSTVSADPTRHVLSGILRCTCGAPCELHAARPNRKGPGYYRVYRCIRRCHSVGETRLLGTLLHWLDALQTDEAFLADQHAALERMATAIARETREERLTAQKEIAKARRREDRWKALYVEGKLEADAYLPTAGELAEGRAMWEGRLAVLEGRLTGAQARLEDFRAQIDVLGRMPRLPEVWPDLTPAEQATYFQTLVESVAMGKAALVVNGWSLTPQEVPYLDGRRKGENPLDLANYTPGTLVFPKAGKGTCTFDQPFRIVRVGPAEAPGDTPHPRLAKLR